MDALLERDKVSIKFKQAKERMVNKVLQMAMLVGIGLVAVSGYGAGVSQENNLIMHQMLVKVDEYTNTIFRLQKENAQMPRSGKEKGRIV